MIPSYPHRPIASVDSLAKSLATDVATLKSLAANSDAHYRIQNERIKTDGSKRITYDVSSALKRIHERIKVAFLKQVNYPEFLQGGLSGRDYLSNTRKHTNKRIIISEDVSNFFPSISKKIVHQVWTGVFKFSNEVSAILTDLVTYDGYLVQGSKTSGYLCNLILWSREAKLVRELEQKGMVYTRFVDDICVSSEKHIDKEEISNIISKIYTLFRSVGAKPNRNKHVVMSKGHRQTVHRVNVDKGVPSFSKANRRKIKAAVHECEKLYTSKQHGDDYRALYLSVLGRVNTLQRLHVAEATALKKRLNKIKP